MRQKADIGLFWHWGKGIYRFRKLVVALWVVLFVGLVMFAQKAPELFTDNGFTPKGSHSDKGMVQLQEKLGFPATNLSLVYVGEQAKLTDPGEQQRIMASLEELRKLPFVADVQPIAAPRKEAEGGEHVLAVGVTFHLTTDEALARYPEVKGLISAPEGMKVYVTGGTAIMYDMQQASKNDIAKSEIIGLPIALIVLLIIFGTVVGAMLPLIVGVTSVTVTLGITYFIAKEVSLSNFLPNMVTMLGLAVGIDYALFLVSRFREELKKRGDVGEAVAMTSQTAGQSIFFSGLAVLIGLFGMLFIDLSLFRSLCLGGVIVVTVSVAVGNTLLLALLGLFGHSINKWRVVPARFAKTGGSRMWEKIAYAVMKRPAVLVLITSAALVWLMLPIGSMKLGVPGADVLPPSYESRYGSDLIDKAYDSRELSPIQIAIQTEGEIWEEDSIAEIDAYTAKLKQLPGVKEVRSFQSVLGNLSASQTAELVKQDGVRRQLEEQRLAKDRYAVIAVVPEWGPRTEETEKLLRDIRKLDVGSLHTLETGETGYRVDILDKIVEGLPYVVGFVMIVTYFVLLAAFRSVLLPLKAVLMNVLSLGASLGIVVTVFQHGFMADILQITSTGYVTNTLPVIIFCVVFGISMDYEVFLISRIIEEYEETGDNEHSTATGLKLTGSLITSAAFILVVVVGAFIFTDIEIIKALGLGLSFAVLIDATIIRILVVPALMKLLGKANWWAPSWLKR
ncbi:MMPL family transporter [Paenibacillus sp. MBLB4367]|uniref:MMPL family transporter n=1 Tax=Paenibacillus sp. MBLB4367 TaxID=3384767 RepID=UPI0039080A16